MKSAHHSSKRQQALRNSSTTTAASSITSEAREVLQQHFQEQSESADDIEEEVVVVIQRRQRPETVSMPGAFHQGGTNQVAAAADAEHRSNLYADNNDDNLGSNNDTALVTAELVLEDNETAADEEIARLTRELAELREQQQSISTAVIAEPMMVQQDNTTATTEFNTNTLTTTSVPKKRMQSSFSSKSNHKPSRRGLVEEIDIYEPSWKPEKHDHEQQLETTNHHKPMTNRLRPCRTLYGREEEMAILQDCLLKQGDTKQLVMISGHSGCGKTALACSLQPTIAEEGGLYVSGKFDLYLRDQPYFGIAAACREICHAIKSLVTNSNSLHHHRKRRSSFQEIRNRLKSHLSPQEISILTPVTPELLEIMECNDEERITPRQRTPAAASCSNPTMDGQDAKNRFNYAFRLFLRVVSQHFVPLVLVLDDLQWADAASLEAMQVLLTDPEISNLLIIGLYRSNEVVSTTNGAELESHLLVTVLNDLKQGSRRRGEEHGNDLEITEIEIGNLNEEAALSVVMDMLTLTSSSPQLTELASLCHKRTLGNAFFLMSFLSMLEEDGLLTLTQKGVYVWDVEEIMTQTGATSNLVDLMKRKMSKLCKEMIQLLSLAACLGSSFERSNLHVAWNLLYPLEQLDDVSIQKQLSAAVEEGFLECIDEESSKCQWTHDKVHESAFSLIPEDKASYFKIQVGTVLHKEMDPNELEENIFLVVNLLNEASSDHLDSAHLVHLAQLNLQATHKARSCSAFSSAAKCASKGIACLPADCWSSSHYALALELHCCAVELNELIGNDDAMKVSSDAVLSNQSVPLLNKVRVYSALASRLGNSGQLVEAIDLLLEVLGLLGCKFPTSSAIRLCKTLSGAIKYKMGAKKRTSVEASRLPILQDPVKVETIKLLDKLSTFCYQSGSDLLPLTIFKSTKLTLKHGVCEVSSPAFAASAAMLGGIMGDLNAGFVLGRCSLKLEEKVKFGVSSSRTKFLAGTTTYPWQRPLQEACSLLLESYSDGMASGDTESAAYGISYYIMLCFLRGVPLKQLALNCSVYSKQMKELKRDTMHAYITITWQASLNMMGHTADPVLLQGSALTDYDQFLIDHQDNLIVIAFVRSFQLGLCAFYGEHERGANLFLAHGFDLPEVGPNDPLFMPAVSYGGISAFQMARTTGKRKFKRHARKARSIIKGWAKQGNPNSAHFDALMDAELAALQSKHKQAEMYYQSAISTAARGGFVQDCALANELYGEFMLYILSNETGASFHIKEAAKLYSDWGAAKKVAMLKDRHSQVFI